MTRTATTEPGMDVAGLPTVADFARTQPGSADAVALASRIERALHAHATGALERAVRAFVAALDRTGYGFEEDAAEPLAFRAVVPDVGVVTLSVGAGVGTACRLVDAQELGDEDMPDWERRFYAGAERARERAAAVGFDALAPTQQMLVCLAGLEADVANGGFDQYFVNSAGDHAHRLPAMLEAIGARATRHIVLDAMAVFPDGAVPADRDARLRCMDALPDARKAPWERLSIRYFAGLECVPQLADDYLRRTDPHWGADGPA